MAYQPSRVIQYQKNSCVTIKTIDKDNGVHAFPKSIISKINVIARLKFEPVYYDVTVQHVGHNVKKTPLLTNY